MYWGNHMGWGLVLALWLGQVAHQVDPPSPLVISIHARVTSCGPRCCGCLSCVGGNGLKDAQSLDGTILPIYCLSQSVKVQPPHLLISIVLHC